MSEKRQSSRKKKRLSCRMLIRGVRYTGVVLDVSETGMFVQTNAKPNPREFVEVQLTLPGVTEPLVIPAKVARKRVVPAALLAVAHGGIGLKIISPTQAYREFVLGVRALAATDSRSAQSSALRSVGRREPKRSAR